MKWVAFSDNPVTRNIPNLPTLPDLAVLDAIPDGQGDVLGEGGGGVTRKVRYDQNWVAVKTFHGAMTTDGLPQEERRMAALAGSLGSPCLIQVLGQTKGGALVMEFLDGYQMFGGRPNFETCWKDVYDDTINRQVTSEEAETIVTGLLDALCQLHHVGICHGDFYGHNILIQETNLAQVRLGDFGGAFFYDTESPYATLIQQCELRSFAVFVEEVVDCLQQGGDKNPETMKISLRNLVSKSLEADTTFQQTQSWWKMKKGNEKTGSERQATR
ncbi:leucine rich repeat [Seminavis robusta]|uniref:Leucine rich repeat n=1 Tax=Seminavis robusta TaxID=568900 RepID=A0A9N8HC32_9STRA|nr:leucine rich repeat [Seminavis robusta]|eukprot:Sro205_g086070.1 leucine rich repeat (272) ;mRNA; f:1368-2183